MEAMLVDLLEDDRFFLHHDCLWEGRFDQLEFLTLAPDYFWERIAGALHVLSPEFKSLVLDCAVVSIGYLWVGTFQPLSQPPWKCCLGDIDASIQELRDGPTMSDRTSWKMQMMVRLGYDAEVASGLRLMRQTSLTAVLVEQAHGSAAQVVKRHVQVGAEIMCAALLVQKALLRLVNMCFLSTC